METGRVTFCHGPVTPRRMTSLPRSTFTNTVAYLTYKHGHVKHYHTYYHYLTTLRCVALRCVALRCVTLRCVAWRGVAWRGVAVAMRTVRTRRDATLDCSAVHFTVRAGMDTQKHQITLNKRTLQYFTRARSGCVCLLVLHFDSSFFIGANLRPTAGAVTQKAMTRQAARWLDSPREQSVEMTGRSSTAVGPPCPVADQGWGGSAALGRGTRPQRRNPRAARSTATSSGPSKAAGDARAGIRARVCFAKCDFKQLEGSHLASFFQPANQQATHARESGVLRE